VSFYNNAGSINVIADIVGYYADHDHDDRYYTKAQADHKTMFAMVNVDGSLRRGTPGTSSSQVPAGKTGDYSVIFPRPVANCGWVASVTASVDGNNPMVGHVGVTTLAGNANGLYIQGTSAAGADAELPFAVIATCP
jgi:hypothetical protein